MNRRHSIRLGSWLVALALVGAAWFLFAPAQVGGRTSYAVIKGNSMEPGLHEGDLAIVRSRASYDVGDAVLFASETLGGAHVLHRIVAAEGGRFVTRGDNRTEDDPERFVEDTVVGGLWFTIPEVGSALEWVARPFHLAVAVFLLALVALAGGREVSKRRYGRPVRPVAAVPVVGGRPAGRWYPVLGSVLVAGLVAGALFAALAALAWTRPASELEQVPDGYVHGGAFTYESAVPPSTVYPEGLVSTGQAVFSELVDRVTFGFDYHFTSVERSSLRGSISLDAVLSDTRGWTRSLVLAPSEPFEGGDARIEGVLDLRRLESVVERMRELTSSSDPVYSLSIAPRVDVAGYTGSTVIDTAFEPMLPLRYDGLSLRLDTQAGEEPPLTPTADGTTAVTRETRVGFGALSIATGDARAFAAVGLVVALLLVAATALLLARRLRRSDVEVLHVRHGSRIIEAQIRIPDGRWVSDVSDPASIGAIAAHYDRVILHAAEPGGDVYLVDDGVAVYRYRVPSRQAAAASVSPAPGR